MTLGLCPTHPEKRRFRSREEANDAARYQRRKVGHIVRAYDCPACGGHHLTKRGRR